jgi:hypothetical protein
LINTEHFGLLLQPKLHNDIFYLEGISDIEYTGDPDKRISVYGTVKCFFGDLLHGNQRLEIVLHYYPLKHRSMQHPELQRT